MSRTDQDIEDELLVLQCQGGDPQALRVLIGRWHPRLGRLAWRLTGHRESSRDIVQEAWLAIVRGIARLDDPARFRTWAYRIVRNKCADWTRRRTVRRDALQDLRGTAPGGQPDPASEAGREDEMVRMRHAITALPNDQRAMLALYYLDGLSIGDISRALGLPRGTVKSRLHHARNRLRQVLERIRA